MLKCKVCGFQHKTELVSHIESAHADRTGGQPALDWYMAEYGAEVDDVVAPKKSAKAKPAAVATATMVKINSVEMPTHPTRGEYVPRHNAAYVFNEQSGDICHDILERKNILLTGHTGTGKTSLIEQIASRTNQGVLRVNMNGQTTVGDFVGMWTVKGGETVWIDGTLPKAMREGHWLIIDELDFAEPAILSVLNAVLEPGASLMLKEKGSELVKPHADFRIFGTANGVGMMNRYRSMYQGTNIMNEAFLDRWRVHGIGYLPPEQEVQVIVNTVTRMKGSDRVAKVIVRVGNMIREAFEKEEIACTFSTRRMLDWADMLLRYKDHPQAPFKAAESTIFSKVSKEDAEVIRGIIQRVMIGANK